LFIIVLYSVTVLVVFDGHSQITANGGATIKNREPSKPQQRVGKTSSQHQHVQVDVVQVKVDDNDEIIIKDFERHSGVVVAVKIHRGGRQNEFVQLKQSLCLFGAAYNHQHELYYDHLIFTSLPLPESYVKDLTDIVAPAKLQVVLDTKPLQEEVALLSATQQQGLMKRCHTTDITQLTWGSKCEDSPGDQKWPIAYNWQAEFRTKHIWEHPALKPYQSMLWFDSDALATQVWKQDPVATLIRNQLVLY
jgi:hypothetical protein